MVLLILVTVTSVLVIAATSKRRDSERIVAAPICVRSEPRRAADSLLRVSSLDERYREIARRLVSTTVERH
jgi:hypothetical protein